MSDTIENFDDIEKATVNNVDQYLEERKTRLYLKSKLVSQIKSSKKDACKEFNVQLKEANEELEHEIAIVDRLLDKKRVLEAVEDERARTRIMGFPLPANINQSL